MIDLYIPSNTDYEKNGDMTLTPSTASVHAVLNGAWEAELTHPLDRDGRWKYITEESVIRMPSFNGSQLFRVKAVQKSDAGVTAVMEPIFYDAMDDCWITDIRPTNATGQQALNAMLSPNAKYSGQSNITAAETAYYQNVNFLEALNGDIDQSFVNRWGGEILYDNYTVIVNTRVGGDYGVELRYGKNIPKNGMNCETDIRDVVTRLYPKGYNGVTMSNNGYVDSPLLNSYPIIKCASITFDNVKMRADASEDDEDNGVIVCDTQQELDAALTAQCNAQYSAGLDKPKVTIEADMVLLQNTEQYKDYQMIENVSLGDTVHCRNGHLGITTDARVIELEYDSIRKKVSSVVIGDFKANYFDGVTSAAQKIDSVIAPNGSLIAEKVQGILNGMETQMVLQSTVAQKVSGVAFRVEDTDPTSDLYGCMIWGTQGIQISTTPTADGRDWDWTTAITARGIHAETIVTGLLADQTGKNYWNLDTGEFYSETGVFAGELQAATGTFAGELKAATGSFSGKITATSGYIGNGAAGWTIADSAIYNGCTSIGDTRAGTYVGTNGIRNYASADSFTTITGGKITSNNVDLAGKITATSGYIGGNEITQEHLEVKAQGGLIVANTANICMRDVQGELKAIIRPYTYDNNPNLAINAMGNILYLGAFDTPRGIYAMEGMFYDNGQTYISSDRRLKENVKEIGAEDSLAFLRKLHPVSFRYTGKPEVHHGLIAQEVREAIDGEWNVVTEYEHMEDRETGKSVTRLTLAYMEIIADLIGAIQALDGRVEYLWKNH